MSRRRQLVQAALAALAGLAAIGPGGVLAQAPARVARVAALFNGSRDAEHTNLEQFMRGLREHGYVDGRNIVLDVRYGDGNVEGLAGIVRELVAQKPDVLLLQGSQAIRAGKYATTGIPIVMVTVADPVGQGLVASLARPGANITGLTILVGDDISKRLQLLREVLPRATRIGYFTNLANPAAPSIWRQLERTAGGMGVRMLLYDARDAAGVDTALAAVAKQRPDGVIIESDVVLGTARMKLVEFFLQQKIATIWPGGRAASDGGLLSYGPRTSENWAKAVAYVDRILKGVRPADLPVEQPRIAELILNRKTAKALNITFPPSILARADRIVE